MLDNAFAAVAGDGAPHLTFSRARDALAVNSSLPELHKQMCSTWLETMVHKNGAEFQVGEGGCPPATSDAEPGRTNDQEALPASKVQADGLQPVSQEKRTEPSQQLESSSQDAQGGALLESECALPMSSESLPAQPTVLPAVTPSAQTETLAYSGQQEAVPSRAGAGNLAQVQTLLADKPALSEGSHTGKPGEVPGCPPPSGSDLQAPAAQAPTESKEESGLQAREPGVEGAAKKEESDPKEIEDENSFVKEQWLEWFLSAELSPEEEKLLQAALHSLSSSLPLSADKVRAALKAHEVLATPDEKHQLQEWSQWVLNMNEED